MKLPTNNRYDYVSIKDRIPYEWPNGTRLAVCLSNNVEHFAYKAGLGLNDSAVSAPADYRSYAWRDYGNRIGIWRMFDVFDDLDIPWSHNVNSTVMEFYPDIVASPPSPAICSARPATSTRCNHPATISRSGSGRGRARCSVFPTHWN